jgi:hypothetical protein
MKKILYKSITAMTIVLFLSCDDFLDRPPFTQFNDETFWTNETNVKAFAFRYYDDRFSGFGTGDSRDNYFAAQATNDDFAQASLPGFTRTQPPSNGAWNGTGNYFTQIRNSNLFINRLGRVPFNDTETANHWMGIARFFRAFDYSRFVLAFGQVPWYDRELTETDPELYRPRDPVAYVMDRVLEDFEFASANVKRWDDNTGNRRQVVNSAVVDAFMSRCMLWVATTIKYNPYSPESDRERLETYLNAAKDAAYRVMTSGDYSLSPDYQKLFSCPNLETDNTGAREEMIMFRHYVLGIVQHSIGNQNGDNGRQTTCATKDLLDSYLCANGKPIALENGNANPIYLGDKTCDNQMAARDPRLTAIFHKKFYIAGAPVVPPVMQYSSSGFMCYKFLDLPNRDKIGSGYNDTDAPVVRLGEVMLNYIEACAELADLGLYTVTQTDLNMTINALRNRGKFVDKLPPLQIINGLPAICGEIYDDPERIRRDQDVSPFIWEVRRERRVELVYEGYRLSDIKRWRKADYLKTDLYPKKNLGAWITKLAEDNTDMKNHILADITGNVVSDAGAAPGEGYIRVAKDHRTEATHYVLERIYLEHVPTLEIQLYKEKGVELTQNPGWASSLTDE